MASNELIIDDDYCNAMGEYFVKQGEEIDKLRTTRKWKFQFQR